MTDAAPTFEALDALSTDELRHRAFQRAERHRDVGFFWDLIEHLPRAGDLASEDASAGNIGGSIGETAALVREVFEGDGMGEREPLFRARFIDYLMKGD